MCLLRTSMDQPRPFHVNRRAFMQGALGLAATLALGQQFLTGCATRDATAEGLPAVPTPRNDPATLTLTDAPALRVPPLFDSVMLGGFECSTHYRKDQVRLDLIASTRHDVYATWDYWRLHQMGLSACRDAARWHLIESSPGQYTFDSLLPMVKAAQVAKMQVIWDLMHYGWPDHIDIYGGSFPTRFARYAKAAVKLIDEYSDQERPLFITPVNEISFLAWAGGDNAYLNPYHKGRGHELKRQLVRAAIESMDAIREVCPRVRFMHCDPIVNVAGRPSKPEEKVIAEEYRMAQYQALDMLRGEVDPWLGGDPKYLDIIGVNYYRNNQTWYDGKFIGGDSPYYKPLADMLEEVWLRYHQPMLIAETGIEAGARQQWMRYVAGESAEAMRRGVELHGITWYPILDHPGWEDDRHCPNGLWGYADATGERPIHEPLANEILRQTKALTVLRAKTLQEAETRRAKVEVAA